MRARFTPLAEADLEDIGDYIARDSRQRALSFVRKLRERCVKIAQLPRAARLPQTSARASGWCRLAAI